MEAYPMRWFRFYDEALNDPKVQQLPDAAFKYWVNLLCLANQGKPRGRFRRSDVAYALRISDERATKMLSFFIERELFEEEGEWIVPHGWDSRQFQSDNVTERTRKHRGNVPGNVPKALQGTPPDTEADTDTESPLEFPPKSKRNGSRTTWRKEWQRPPEWDEYARTSCGMTPDGIEAQWRLFRAHWLSEGGGKADWEATWHKWLENAKRFDRTGGSSNGATGPDMELIAKAKEMARAAGHPGPLEDTW